MKSGYFGHSTISHDEDRKIQYFSDLLKLDFVQVIMMLTCEGRTFSLTELGLAFGCCSVNPKNFSFAVVRIFKTCMNK